MKAFADLLDRLSLPASRNAKLTLVRDYLRETPDPDRGWALAALTGDLSFDAAKPAFIRKAVEERMDPQLFWWSYDYVGDLAEAGALVLPKPPRRNRRAGAFRGGGGPAHRDAGRGAAADRGLARRHGRAPRALG